MAFPVAVDSFSTKVDNVDIVHATDVNNLQTSVVNIENALTGGATWTSPLNIAGAGATLHGLLTVASGGASITGNSTITGNLTVSGGATFTAGPISAPAGSIPLSAVSGAAADSAVVHLAGSESITGTKTFSTNPVFNTAGIPLSAVSGSIGGQFGKGQPWFDLGSYLAKGDAKQVTDGAMTAASAVLTSATASFTSADVGKVISVSGAGATVAGSGLYLQTIIQSFQSSTQVTLAATASNTVSGATVTYGTDDTTAISNWLTAAAAAGGIAVSPGLRSYIFSSLSITGDNLLIDGFGSTFYSSYANDNTTNALVLVGNGLAIQRLTLKALSPKTPSQRSAGGNLNNGDLLRIGGTTSGPTWKNRITVRDCYFSGAFGGNIDIYFANQALVRGNRCDNADGNNINVTNCQNDVVVTDNICNNSGDDSIVCVTDSNVSGGTVRVTISNNTVNGADAKGIGGSGISYGVIANNQIYNTYAPGIHLLTDAAFSLGPCNRVVIEGNTIQNAGQRYGGSFLHGVIGSTPHGIEIGQQSSFIKIANNLIVNPGGRGIDVQTPTVTTTLNIGGALTFPVSTITVASTTNFPISGTAQVMDVNGVSTTFNYTGKTATTFTGVTGGSGTYADVTTVVNLPSNDITIVGNTVYQCAADTGIIVGNPDVNDNARISGVTIVGNEVRSTLGGIIVGTITGFTISGNAIRSYGAGGAGRRGIQIGFARNGAVTGNVVFNDDGSGPTIFLYNTQTFVRVHGNVTRDTPTQTWMAAPGFATPAFPATGTRVANQTGMDVMVYLTAGTNAITQVLINGPQGQGQQVLPGVTATAGGGTTGPIRLPAGGDIQLTYTAGGAPSWLWLAD